MVIRVALVGLGPIGAAVAKQLLSRGKAFKIVAAVDTNREMFGRDAGEVMGLGRALKVKVTSDVTRTLKAAAPDVAVVCTSSSLQVAAPLFEQVLARKVPIVTTTEEAAYPQPKNRRVAKKIDEAAKKAKVAVLGTGVNPGFTMDALPIALSAVCERVDSVRIERVQDARIRRLPFQQKIGAGLTRQQFDAKVKDGSVRHVGFAESIQMIADALGWKLDRVTDEVQPKMADKAVAGELLAVDPGYVAGIVQDGAGYVDGKPRITLHLEAYLGAPESYDAVTIEGSPRIHSKVVGGVHGDIATAAMVVNSIPKVLVAPPGLRTMRDMVLPSFFRG